MECTTLTPNVKHCEQCGKEYTPNKLTAGRQRFCSDRCRNAVKLSPHWYTCLHCGKQYRAKAKDRDTCCSRDCWYAWLDANPVLGPEPAPEPMPLCEVCGQPVSNRNAKLCGSDECAKARYLRLVTSASTRDRSPRACKECGEVFTPEYGNLKRVFCSKKCINRYFRRRQKRSRGTLNQSARKRLRQYYGDQWREHYEPINKDRVFKRDKMTCQLCGCKLKRSKVWSPQQATIDHIVPLSLGGAHRYENVQAACMMCNSTKGGTAKGQMRLIG